MKIFKGLLVFVLLVGLFATNFTAQASSYSTGKAVIPAYLTSSSAKTVFSVSNITDEQISVTVTLYEKDGTIITDDNSSSAGRITGSNLLNYDDQNTDSTLTFTLDAHCTGYFSTNYTSSVKFGYGVIQWQQDSNALLGLVVVGAENIYVDTDADSRYLVPVNNGLPF
jgi:hypothetical protein